MRDISALPDLIIEYYLYVYRNMIKMYYFNYYIDIVAIVLKANLYLSNKCMSILSDPLEN